MNSFVWWRVQLFIIELMLLLVYNITKALKDPNVSDYFSNLRNFEILVKEDDSTAWLASWIADPVERFYTGSHNFGIWTKFCFCVINAREEILNFATHFISISLQLLDVFSLFTSFLCWRLHLTTPLNTRFYIRELFVRILILFCCLFNSFLRVEPDFFNFDIDIETELFQVGFNRWDWILKLDVFPDRTLWRLRNIRTRFRVQCKWSVSIERVFMPHHNIHTWLGMGYI